MAHTLQFFGFTEDRFVHDLADYACEGFDVGEPLVAIVEAHRSEALLQELRRRRSEPDLAREDGRFVLLDAQRVLAQLDRNGRIDGYCFDNAIGRLMREVVARSRSRRVRAYGDMAGMLWRDGRRDACIELERYWNDLQAQLPFDLFCGYSVDVFADDFEPHGLSPLLCEHSCVVPQQRNDELQNALDFAVYESFGRHLSGIGSPDMPTAEATILWIREYLPGHAREILQRAKRYAESVA